MPLRLDVSRVLLQRTDRVKGVDIHPTEPWLLANLYNGNVYIWNYNDQSVVNSFEVTDLPVRTAKFVARKQWVVCGADDNMIRVYSYNTMDKIKAFEAHTDYIRCVAVHPTMPYILSSSDDMLIKLWDWDKGWSCVQVFEGHSHYVMQVAFNPKDSNTFASASLDRTIKVWSVGQPAPNFTLEGHEKGVNTVDYFTGGDRPYLISGADDRLVKIWDYQTKACVNTLEGHQHNISAVAFHPELPIIITGSEDGSVKLWHSTTYRLETTLTYGMERVWAVSVIKGSKSLAIGYDDGAVMIKVGREEPVASMDSSGKIIWARHNEIQTVNVKSLGSDIEVSDGDRIPLPVKDLGSCDLYPQALEHNPNGRFVTVCGDGEYIVYTALAWRNKSFGSALEFVWSSDSNEYATRESTSKVKIFKNFQEKTSIKIDYSAEGIFGGALIAVRSVDFVAFYDWNSGALIRRIDVPVKNVLWSDVGDLVAIISETSFYILRFNRQEVDDMLASGEIQDEDGFEDAFELLNEISDVVSTGFWVGDCFVYNNASMRLNYCVGGEVTTMYHLDRPMYLLGYLAAQSRVYLIDKEYAIISYTLSLSMIEFKTLIMRDDIDGALDILKSVPEEQLNTAAKFLESRGLVDKALEIATDPHYRFDLALQVDDIVAAQEIALQLDSPAKWRQLGEMCLQRGKLKSARSCLEKAKDLSGLLLLHTCFGDTAGLQSLADEAVAQGKHNVAFVCLFLLHRPKECTQLLQESGRLPEATLFARTYSPSAVSSCLQLWKADLLKLNPKAAESLADPDQYPNLFPDFQEALQAELASGPVSNGVVRATSNGVTGNGNHAAPPPAPFAAVVEKVEAVAAPAAAVAAMAAAPVVAAAAVEDDDEEEDEDEDALFKDVEEPTGVTDRLNDLDLEDDDETEGVELDDDWGLNEDDKV